MTVPVPPIAKLGAPHDEGVVHDRAAANVRHRFQGTDEARDLAGVIPDVVGHRRVFCRVVVDIVRNTLVHLVADGGGTEFRGRHLAERQRHHPGDVAAERRGDDVRERVESHVVLLERRRRSRRSVARQRGQPFQPVPQSFDEPEVGLETSAVGGAELRGELAIFVVGEVERRPAAPADGVAG